MMSDSHIGYRIDWEFIPAPVQKAILALSAELSMHTDYEAVQLTINNVGMTAAHIVPDGQFPTLDVRVARTDNAE